MSRSASTPTLSSPGSSIVSVGWRRDLPTWHASGGHGCAGPSAACPTTRTRDRREDMERRGWFSMEQFNTPTLVLMALAIAINIAVGNTVQNVIKLPIYLDSIGTVLVGVLAGPLAGALTGVLANVIWGFTLGPTSIAPFAVTAAFIGFLAGVIGARGIFSPKRGGMGVAWVIVGGFLT